MTKEKRDPSDKNWCPLPMDRVWAICNWYVELKHSVILHGAALYTLGML